LTWTAIPTGSSRPWKLNVHKQVAQIQAGAEWLTFWLARGSLSGWQTHCFLCLPAMLYGIVIFIVMYLLVFCMYIFALMAQNSKSFRWDVSESLVVGAVKASWQLTNPQNTPSPLRAWLLPRVAGGKGKPHPATLYYFSEIDPGEGNYWRYVDDVPTVW